MKITETIFAQLIDVDTILESVYQAIAEVDPNYVEEMAVYEQGVQALLQEVPSFLCSTPSSTTSPTWKPTAINWPTPRGSV